MKPIKNITLDEIKRILKENEPVLKNKFKIKEIGIFGSFLRGEQKKTSDLDILVEFSETLSLLDFISIERQLSELLGVKVDLVMKSGLKPRIGGRILQEVVYL